MQMEEGQRAGVGGDRGSEADSADSREPHVGLKLTNHKATNLSEVGCSTN